MTAFARLWRRAPAWRGALVMAGVSTGLAALYPAWWTAAPAASVSSYAPPSQPPPVAGAPAAPGPSAVPPFGQSYAGVVPFAGRLLPLPRGDWVVVASNNSQGPDGQLAAAAVLAQVSNGQVAAMLVAVGVATPIPAHQGFSTFYECQKPRMIYARVFSDVDHGPQACWAVETYSSRYWTAPSSAPLLRAAAGGLAQRNLAVPPLMVGVLFHNADQDHLTTLRYYFTKPASAGAPQPGDGDWTKAGVMRAPEKLAVVQGVQAWGQRFRSLAQQSFDGLLTSADVTGPVADLP